MKIIKAARHEGINPGGDCGPCCLSGITGIPVREIYDKYFNGRIDGTCYTDMLAACWKLYAQGKIKHIDTELPPNNKRPDHEYMIFGNPSWENFIQWTEHVKQKTTHAVGIAQVHMTGDAMGDRKHQWYHNHWLLITGAEMGESAAGKVVHVSCPTLGEYTKQSLEFLMNYGGYNPIWIYPNTD